jgi:alpha-tubulin suppressor-like RCC1 family protein
MINKRKFFKKIKTIPSIEIKPKYINNYSNNQIDSVEKIENNNPMKVSKISNISQIAENSNHELKSNNESDIIKYHVSQITDISLPTPVEAQGLVFTRVACGKTHIVAITNNGKL